MHPVRFFRTLLKRVFEQWISPADRAVRVAHDIRIARRRAERRPLARPLTQPIQPTTGRPRLRLIQGGRSQQQNQMMRKNV